MDNQFSKLVYTLRKEKGWTQAELGEKLGLTDKAVSRWENGESFPETAQLVPLSNLFGISIDELLKGERRQNTGTGASESAEAGGSGQAYTGRSWQPVSKDEPLTTRQAVQVAVGVGLILLGVLFIIVGELLTVPSGVSLITFFVMLSVAVLLFINMGMNKQLADFKAGAELIKAANTYILMIAIGVGLMIMSPTGFFINMHEAAQFCVLFGALTAGIILTIIGGVGWERDVLRKIGGVGWENRECCEGERGCCENGKEPQTQKTHRRSRMAEKASSVTMLLATAAFLLMGFLWNLWHPGWIVFPVGGILCGIISVIFERR